MGKPGMAMPGEHRSPSPFRDGTHTHNIRHGRSRNWNRAGGVRDNVPKIAMAFWHECRPFGTQVVVDRPPGTSVPVFPMPCLRHWCPVNVRDVTFGTDTWPRNVNIGRMAHKYPNILIHCVFSTKERKALIPEETIPRLCKYFAGIGAEPRYSSTRRPRHFQPFAFVDCAAGRCAPCQSDSGFESQFFALAARARA